MPERKMIAVVETSESIEQKARDVGDAEMTAEKGKAGFFSQIFKHGLLRDIYRQTAISKAKKGILSGGVGQENIYADEGIDRTAHEETMGAIADRFLSEADNAVHRGELKQTLDDSKVEEHQIKNAIQLLIKKYATGENGFDDAQFIIERNSIYKDLKELGLRVGDHKIVDRGLLYADNLHQMAREARDAYRAVGEHNAGLAAIDYEYDVVVGKAKAGVRTEAQYTHVDQLVAKAQEFSGKYLGGLFNEAYVAAGVAFAYTLATRTSQSIARSRILAWTTFGATGAIGGLVAAGRERTRLEDFRRQHLREMAQGKKFEENKSPVRKDMELYRYETKNAGDLINNIRDALTREDVPAVIDALAEAESRIRLSDRENIDLISYSNEKTVDRERLVLDEIIAKAKVELRRKDGFSEPALDSLTETKLGVLEDGDQGMERKNELFKKMKRSRAWRVGVKGVVTSLVVGAALQEVFAFTRSEQVGLLEHDQALDDGSHQYTALRGLWEKVTGGFKHDENLMHQSLQLKGGDIRFWTPEGVEMSHNPDGTYDLVRANGDTIVGHLKLNEDGTLSSEAIKSLSKAGVLPNHVVFQADLPEDVTYTPEDYLDAHPDGTQVIRRDLWMDNDTKAPDFNLNEQGLDLKMAPDGSGRYMFSINRMTEDGSFHHDALSGSEIDVPAELKGNGHVELKLSATNATQTQPFEFTFDKHGHAYIEPNSTAGQLIQIGTDGQPHVAGRFAEAVYSDGVDSAGVEHVKVLATAEGPGVDHLTGIENKHFFKVSYRLFPTDVEYNIDPPFIVPIIPRVPIEPVKKEQDSTPANGPELESGYSSIVSGDRPTDTVPSHRFSSFENKILIDEIKSGDYYEVGAMHGSTIKVPKGAVLRIEKPSINSDIFVEEGGVVEFADGVKEGSQGLRIRHQGKKEGPDGYDNGDAFHTYGENPTSGFTRIELGDIKDSKKVIVKKGEELVLKSGQNIENSDIVVEEGGKLTMENGAKVARNAVIRVKNGGSVKLDSINDSIIVASDGSSVEVNGLNSKNVKIYAHKNAKIDMYNAKNRARRGNNRIELVRMDSNLGKAEREKVVRERVQEIEELKKKKPNQFK